MIQVRCFLHLFLLAGLLFSSTGCNDDGCPACPENEPEKFQITLTCTDEAGLPLANVVVGAMPGLPESVWSWGPNGADEQSREKSSTILRVELSEELRIRVIIRDVERNLVRNLVEDLYPQGGSSMMWDGCYGDTYVHTPPGYYEAVLMVDEGGEMGWAAVDSIGLFQAAFDPGQYDYGSTDASGRLTITDRRLVPAFNDLLPLQHVDEEGVGHGLFTLTTETWLCCGTTDGRSVWGVFQAEDEHQEVTVVFTDEIPAGTQAPAGKMVIQKKVVGKRDLRASFGLPKPNPFN